MFLFYGETLLAGDSNDSRSTIHHNSFSVTHTAFGVDIQFELTVVIKCINYHTGNDLRFFHLE